MQDGVHHGDGGQTGVGLNVHGDAAAVIGDLNDIVLQDLDLDVVAVTGQRLVNGVVHDLVHQMMQTALTGGADIHTRALAHRLQTLQHLDLAGVILVVGRGIGICTGNDFFCHILSPFVVLSLFTHYLSETQVRCSAPCGLAGRYNYSIIFCALRRMAALDSSERYTASTSPPSAST